MNPTLTVITSTLAEVDEQRAEMMQRNWQSVTDQRADLLHLTDSTVPRDMGDAYNGLMDQVTTPWASLLDDDNYWLPNHYATIAPHLEGDDWDVVYTWETSGSRPRVDVTEWDREYIKRLGQHSNWLDTSCAIRKEAWDSVGGMAGATGTQLKDWDLFRRLVDKGARFKCVPVETWFYQQYAIDGHLLR